jgi:hypothetical protein
VYCKVKKKALKIINLNCMMHIQASDIIFNWSQVWWLTSVILVHRRLRQDDHEFETLSQTIITKIQTFENKCAN